jgi:hypothetical protein
LNKLTRDDLQPGKFLFDKFEVAQVDKNRIWLRAPIGLLVLEAKEEGDVVVWLEEWFEKMDSKNGNSKFAKMEIRNSQNDFEIYFSFKLYAILQTWICIRVSGIVNYPVYKACFN